MDMHRFSWTKNEFWWIFCRLKASEAAFWEHKCARWGAKVCPAGRRGRGDALERGRAPAVDGGFGRLGLGVPRDA